MGDAGLGGSITLYCVIKIWIGRARVCGLYASGSGKGRLVCVRERGNEHWG
jgi:hypothetical protein